MNISNSGLVKGHYFINGTTTLTSYCLENYEEVKGFKGYNNIFTGKQVTNIRNQTIDLLQHIKYSASRNE